MSTDNNDMLEDFLQQLESIQALVGGLRKVTEDQYKNIDNRIGKLMQEMDGAVMDKV